jgi:pumilio family protein 6
VQKLEKVRKAASEDLVTWVEKEGENLVKEPNGCLVVVELMLYAEAGMVGLSTFM